MKKHPHAAKSGFTLVELIVVLVILAILAALLIPSLMQYLNRAREEAAVVQCRQAVIAAQSTLVQKHSKVATPGITRADDGEEILALAELEIPDGSTVDAVFFGEFDVENSVLEHLYYRSGSYYVTYCAKAGGECAQHTQAFTVSTKPVIQGSAQVSASAVFSWIYNLPSGSPLLVSQYDSKSLSDHNSKVYQLWSTMSAEQQAFLTNKTWRLDKSYNADGFDSGGLFTDYKDSSGNGWRLRVVDTEYGPTDNATKVSYSVYAFDEAGNVYRMAYTGGAITNGAISGGSPVKKDSSGKLLPYAGWEKVN